MVRHCWLVGVGKKDPERGNQLNAQDVCVRVGTSEKKLLQMLLMSFKVALFSSLYRELGRIVKVMFIQVNLLIDVF
jgi:hypothetical protein